MLVLRGCQEECRRGQAVDDILLILVNTMNWEAKFEYPLAPHCPMYLGPQTASILLAILCINYNPMMEKKISNSSSTSSKGHARSRSFLEDMLSSRGSEKSKPNKEKTLNLSKKLSTSINMKTEDAIKITSQNFREVLLGLAERILTGNEKGKTFLKTVSSYLRDSNAELDQEV